ncbi:MAG: hypothetical protein ABL876_15460 [Chitinophagaceae bacterium]
MRKIHLLPVLSLFLLVPASITRAQTITQQKGLTTVQFNFPQGTIKVYLPQDIRPGDMISGSFKVEPVSGTAKQQQKAIGQLLKNKLKIGDPNDPAQVALSLLDRYQAGQSGGMLQREKASLPFVVSVIDESNHIISAPVRVRQLYEDDLVSAAGCSMPTHVLTASPLPIKGSFDGDASNTKCSANGQSLSAIAESPRSAVFLLPASAKGEQNISLQEQGKETCTKKISGVDLAVSTGKMNLLKGEKTYLDVTVTGLQRLNDTATLTVTNLSRSIVLLMPANDISIRLLPDSFKTGTFNRRFDIQSVKTGNFSVNVNLDLPGIYYDLKDIKFTMEQHPGSYGWREDDPCENAGPITWRWHRTLPCAIELKVTPYGTTPAEEEVIDFIIEKFKELSKKGGDLGSKMAKCLSFKDKAFSMFARCYRDWDDWDVTYVCVNGRWVQRSMVHVGSGRDNLSGWIPLRNAGGNNEWLKSDSFDWVTEAIAKAVSCCD